MSKQSKFVLEMQAKNRADRNLQREFTIQQMEDMAILTLAEAFGFGEERNSRFRDALRIRLHDMCRDAVKDAEDDEQIVYTKAKIDADLKKAMGKYFEPWEVRFAFTKGKIRNE